MNESIYLLEEHGTFVNGPCSSCFLNQRGEGLDRFVHVRNLTPYPLVKKYTEYSYYCTIYSYLNFRFVLIFIHRVLDAFK